MRILTPWDVDPVLPSQWADPMPDTGERRLVYAVLRDALWLAQQQVPPRRPPRGRARDWVPLPPRGHSPVLEARAWIASDDVQWPYAFLNCCQVFNLDPGAVRAMVARRRPIGHRRAHVARVRPVLVADPRPRRPAG